MSNQTFYLFRHGLATHSLDGYGDQILTAGLLPEAYPAVERLATYLEQFAFEVRLTSPVLRCQQTAAVVSKKINQDFVVDEQLIEYWPEDFQLFSQRISDLTQKLRQSPASNIAICTHGAVIAGLTHKLRNQPFGEQNLADHPLPAGLAIVTTDQAKPITIHNFGD